MTNAENGQSRARMGAAIAPLLGLLILINYVDRGNLATAGPLIKGELGLDATAFGLLVSSFFWTYTPAQLFAGWLADRWGPYRVLALGLVIWSLATAATGLATGFLALLCLRLVLGLGESVAFPCASKILTRGLPPERLGFANGVTSVGLALGPAFGTFAGGLLMAQYGWRPTFVVFGVASLLWLLPWAAATRGATSAQSRDPDPPAPSFLEIMSRREAWGAALGHFFVVYAFYFVISWLPLFLVKTHGLTMARMAEAGGVVYLIYAASAVASGWAADRLVRLGLDASLVRKGFMLVSLLVQAVALVVAGIGSLQTAFLALGAAGLAFGLSTPMVWTIGQTLSGPAAAARWSGFQSGVGNLAGIIAPLVTGLLVDRTGSFVWPFAAAAAAAALGMIAWGLVIGKVAPVKWRDASAGG